MLVNIFIYGVYMVCVVAPFAISGDAKSVLIMHGLLCNYLN